MLYLRLRSYVCIIIFSTMLFRYRVTSVYTLLPVYSYKFKLRPQVQIHKHKHELNTLASALNTRMSFTRWLVASGTLHLGGTVAHRLGHNYNYKLYNVCMLSFVLTGLSHGEYTTQTMCNNLLYRV